MMHSSGDQINKNGQDDFQVLYICSAARSGSTLTDMFIGGHSQAASLGEVNMLGNALSLNAECSCGDKLSSCNHWRKIFDAIDAQYSIDFVKYPYRFRLWDAVAINTVDHRHQTQIYRFGIALRRKWMKSRDFLPDFLRDRFPIPSTLLHALQNKMSLYREISRCWNKSLIIDSSKNFREAIELHQRWPNIVKVLLLTRDGRGVYLSRRSSGRSQPESVTAWLNYYQDALPLLENYIDPKSLLKLRYEDLASDPEKIGNHLCDFLNIDFEQKMLELSKTTRHLVSGNNTRFAPQKGIRLDERWRTDLAERELDFFNSVGGEMNRRLGYY